eukprot:9773296-Alexandrium_andersonii.AAC.1
MPRQDRTAQPYAEATTDRASHQWADRMARGLHRAPREPPASGCIRFASLGVRVDDLVATFPGDSDVVSPTQ